MSLIWGAIMAIGGIVMCFTNHLEIGVALYATAGLSFGFFDISMSIDRLKKRENLEKAINALDEMNDILDKIKEGE